MRYCIIAKTLYLTISQEPAPICAYVAPRVTSLAYIVPLKELLTGSCLYIISVVPNLYYLFYFYVILSDKMTAMGRNKKRFVHILAYFAFL